MIGSRSRVLALLAAASAASLLAACGGGSSGGSSATSSKDFGVNATGTVHFWARQATQGPAKFLVKQFNATHKNLKVVLHLTPPNDDTSQLATAIRAGSVPDVVGLNDIDVPKFGHAERADGHHQVRQCAAVQERAEPRPPQAGHHRQHLLRRALPGRPVGALVQQGAVQEGRAGPEQPADQLRGDRVRRQEDQQAGPRHLRVLVRRQLPGLPGLHDAAEHVGGRPAHAQRPDSASRPPTWPTTPR